MDVTHLACAGMMRLVVRTEGVSGLYRGIAPTLLGIVPYAGLKFYVYQSLKACHLPGRACSCCAGMSSLDQGGDTQADGCSSAAAEATANGAATMLSSSKVIRLHC